MMTMEVISTPSGQMPAYVAAPTDPGPWPGVVVVHGFGGMSPKSRNQADWLADVLFSGPGRRAICGVTARMR